MAEALAALGLVCNVVQLVDGAANLVHLAKEIHQNSEAAQLNASRSKLLADHLLSTKELIHSSIRTSTLAKSSQSSAPGSSQSTLVEPHQHDSAEGKNNEELDKSEVSFYDPDLDRIIDEAGSIADDLVKKLEKYAYKDGERRHKFTSLGKAMKLVFLEQKEIEDMSGRLSRYQKDLNSKLAVFSIYLLQRVESQNQRTHENLNRIDRNIGNIKSDVGHALTSIIADNEANTNRISRQVAGDAEKLHETLGGILEAVRAPQVAQGDEWEVVQRNEPAPDPSPLLEAAKQGDKQRIRTLLATSRISIDARDERQQTALHLACVYGHVVVVRYLRQNGADLNAEDIDGSRPLHVAVHKDQVEVVRLLLGELSATAHVHDNTNQTPRDYAQRSKWSFLLQWMFNNGADLEAEDPAMHRTALLQAAECGELASLKRLLEEGANVGATDLKGASALELATRAGKLECVNELIQRGASVKQRNRQGLTPLMAAVAAGKEAMPTLEALINAGSDVEAKDNSGRTCVWQAFSKSHWDITKFLIRHGANVALRDGAGYSLLNRASQLGRAGVIATLLAVGVDPNEKNDHEWTGLHEAAFHGHPYAVEELLKHPQVDINARHRQGYTALHDACRQHRPKCVRLLLATKKVDVNTVNQPWGWGCLAEVCDSRKGKVVPVQLEILKMLLAERPNVNIQDQHGYTPLSIATMGPATNPELRKFRAEIVAELLKVNELNVDIGNKAGWTPLMEASFYGNITVLELLLKRGTNVEAKGEYHDHGDVKANGVTPLMLAAKMGHKSVIESLLNHDPPADIHVKDSRTYTALTIAVKHGKTQAAYALALRGASVKDTLSHEGEIASPNSKAILGTLHAWED